MPGPAELRSKNNNVFAGVYRRREVLRNTVIFPRSAHQWCNDDDFRAHPNHRIVVATFRAQHTKGVVMTTSALTLIIE